MNNFHSQAIDYHPRWVARQLKDAIKDASVVVLTGARQVGKSTLLQNEAPFRDWRFLSLDDYDTLRQANEHPEGLWAGVDCIILDEVQKAPTLLSAVKRAVDRKSPRVRFVLSGSTNLLLMKQVSESLAGRALYLVLDPFTLGEIQSTQTAPISPPDLLQHALVKDWPTERTLPEDLPDAMPLLLQGLMPPLLHLDTPQSWTRWWDGYVTTYLERDLRQVSQIDALMDFRRLMQFVALRSGQLLNQSELARDAGLSQPTVHRYLNILETTHLFQRLPPYLASRTTRLLKSPKAFWNDPGLAVFLSGYYDPADLRRAREVGGYFETFIYHHLRVLAGELTPPAKLYFWRTHTGQEVDFVLEHGRHVLAIEVKQTAQPGYGDTAGLRSFLAEHPEASGGLLLHSGREIRRVEENIVSVPWSQITG